MHRRDPHDGNPGSAWPPRAEQSPRCLQPTGVDIGFQQGKLNQIVLCAAAANTLVLTGEGSERLYCRGEIAPFERSEASRQRRQV